MGQYYTLITSKNSYYRQLWSLSLLFQFELFKVIWIGLFLYHQTKAATGGVLQEKAFIKILQYSQENTCARVFFNKVSGLSPATLLKKRLWNRCFPVNFVRFLRTPFLQNTSGRLLLRKLKAFCFVSFFVSFVFTGRK